MTKIQPDELCPCGSGSLFKQCHGPKVRKHITPEIKETFALKIIPEPDPNTRAVFIKNSPGTIVFKGNISHKALVCGKCESALIVGLEKEQIQNVVIQCNNCKSFNEVS